MGTSHRSTRKGATSDRRGKSPAESSGVALARPAEAVKQLSTAEGRAEAYADLYVRAIAGGTRDEISGLTLAKHCIDRFGALEKDRELPERLTDLEAQLTEVRAALAGRKGSALRVADAVIPPMEDSAIRTDMAPAPAAQGHREPYQS